MFNSITIPFGPKMLFNVVKLKPGYTIEDVEIAVGEMCNVVKNKYQGDGGFIAGQVFKYSGFISDEGSLGSDTNDNPSCLSEDHVVIVTYWNSFEQHEISHADATFKERFSELGKMCEHTFEVGYDMLWQGMPE